jgi:hypothetical protein
LPAALDVANTPLRYLTEAEPQIFPVRGRVGNALSVLLITLVMSVLVDVPLAALFAQVAITG